MNKRGTPITHTQRQFGHRSLATTQIYLQQISPAEVIETVAGLDF
jgi:site-specific recombinase XerD